MVVGRVSVRSCRCLVFVDVLVVVLVGRGYRFVCRGFVVRRLIRRVRCVVVCLWMSLCSSLLFVVVAFFWRCSRLSGGGCSCTLFVAGLVSGVVRIVVGDTVVLVKVGIRGADSPAMVFL